MKKYKLIKKYPGCGYKLNQIIETDVIWVNNTKIYLKDYPENWEKVVEKDYEILSFKNKLGTIYPCGNQHESNIKNQLRESEIYSVKRLSDGEVFTVDDNNVTSIKADIINYPNLKFTIKGFNIINNKLVITLNAPNEVKFRNSILLKNLKHIKKPLFTTEDGVDILPKEDGEFQYWSLKLDSWKISNAPHILNSNKIIPTKTEDLLRGCNELRFSTREAAEEYILMNKPCLSLNDVFNIYPKLKRNSKTIWTKHALKLKELAKSKK